MKTLNTRWRLIALVPLVAIAILSIGNKISAVPDQNREGDGFIIQGGITQAQVFRFNAVHQVGPGAGPHIVLELKVFDSQGNVVATHLFQFPDPGPNQGNNTWISQYFDLNGAGLSPQAFDNTGRAQLTGLIRHLPSS